MVNKGKLNGSQYLLLDYIFKEIFIQGTFALQLQQKA